MPSLSATIASNVITLSTSTAGMANGDSLQIIIDYQTQSLPAGSNAIGSVSVSNFPATQPISGTVTANAGTNLNTSALALDATLTGGTQKTKLIDTGGTNVASVSAAGALKVDGSAVTQPVSGTVAATQSGTWTVQPGNTANTTPWLATINQGGNSAAVSAANALKVDGSAVTQPISAASLPLPTGAATSANQTTANASLSSIDTKTLAAGQATMAASSPVVIASNQSAIQVVGNVASGATDSGNPVKVGAVYNDGTMPTLVSGQRGDLQTDVNGRLIVSSVPANSVISTYSAAVTGLATAALATDILTIGGSATKTVRIKQLRISATRTTSGNFDITLVRRSTANTGGTSTTLTAVAADSTDAAATATVLAYTANPTTGTLVGTMRSEKYFANTTGTGASDNTNWTFGFDTSKAPVLRGTAQSISVNLLGVTIAGSSFDMHFTWTEE